MSVWEGRCGSEGGRDARSSAGEVKLRWLGGGVDWSESLIADLG